MDPKQVVAYGGTLFIGLVVGAGTVAGTGMNSATPAPVKTITVERPAPAAKTEIGTIPGDGIFKIGGAVHPGTYVSKTAPDQKCQWKRLSSLTPIKVIDSAVNKGTSKIIIDKKDKYFMSSGCVDWKKTK